MTLDGLREGLGVMGKVPTKALKAAAKKAKITAPAAKKMKKARVPSSKRLGDNLRQAGKDGTRNSKNHLTDDAAHLVSKGPTHPSPSVRASQRILKKYGIDIDDAINGTWLPHGRNTAKYPNPLGKSPHQATHRNDFHDALYNKLKHCQSKQDVEDVLDSVRQKLDKGIWPPLKK